MEDVVKKAISGKQQAYTKAIDVMSSALYFCMHCVGD